MIVGVMEVEVGEGEDGQGVEVGVGEDILQ